MTRSNGVGGPGATIGPSPQDSVSPVGRSPSVVVTSAQRARLVVALGLLNLILATVALTAGALAPTRPGPEVAGGNQSAAPTGAASGSPSVPTATTPASLGSGTSQPPGPSESTGAVSPSATPSTEPSASPIGSGPIVAQGPTPTPAPLGSSPPVLVGQSQSPPPTATPAPTVTPRPTAQPTSQPAPQPTPRPTVKPTPQPTARPTPTPTPAPNVNKVKKPRPPCPSAGMPPGHNKIPGPVTRPCGSKGGNGHGRGHGSTGVVFVPPLALVGVATTGRRRLVAGVRRVHRLRTRRSA
jgi:hypothetical protein